MKKPARSKFTIDILFIALLISIMSGCNDGDGSAPNKIHLQPFAVESVRPTDLLILTGIGFDTTAINSVRFSDSTRFKLDIPPLKTTATSMQVVVPPYIKASGAFAAATLNIQVIGKDRGGAGVSNVMENFQVQ